MKSKHVSNCLPGQVTDSSTTWSCSKLKSLCVCINCKGSHLPCTITIYASQFVFTYWVKNSHIYIIQLKANVSFTLKLYQLCIVPSGLQQATPLMFYLCETRSEKWQEEAKRERNSTTGSFCTCSLLKKPTSLNSSVLDWHNFTCRLLLLNLTPECGFQRHPQTAAAIRKLGIYCNQTCPAVSDQNYRMGCQLGITHSLAIPEHQSTL